MEYNLISNSYYINNQGRAAYSRIYSKRSNRSQLTTEAYYQIRATLVGGVL